MSHFRKINISVFLVLSFSVILNASVPFHDDFDDLSNWTTMHTGASRPSVANGELQLNLSVGDTMALISNGGPRAYDFLAKPLKLNLRDVATSASAGASNMTAFGFSNKPDQTLLDANSIFVVLNQKVRLRVVAYRNGTYNTLYDSKQSSARLDSSYESIDFAISGSAWHLITYSDRGSELLNVNGTIENNQLNPGAWKNSYLTIELIQTSERAATTTIGSVSVTEIE